MRSFVTNLSRESEVSLKKTNNLTAPEHPSFRSGYRRLFAAADLSRYPKSVHYIPKLSSAEGCVAYRVLDLLVPKPFLNNPQRVSLLHHQVTSGMPQNMGVA